MAPSPDKEIQIMLDLPLIPVPDGGMAKPNDELCDSCRALNLTAEDFIVGNDNITEGDLDDDDWVDEDENDEGENDGDEDGEDEDDSVNDDVDNDDNDERHRSGVSRHFGMAADVKKKASHCPLCRLVLQALGPNLPDESDGTPIEVIFYWQGDGPDLDNPIIRDIMPSAQNKGGGFIVDPDYRLIIMARIGILANDAPTPDKGYLSRLIKDQIDFGMVRNWIAICETHHKDQCSGMPDALGQVDFEDPVDAIPSFRLIDVIDNCIVLAPRGCKYMTLSYVWGRIDPETILRTLKNNLADLEKRGALVEPRHRDKIPVTIQDAMTVVRELGCRYLWVDSLCIIQDDVGNGGSKMEAIAKMGLVYGAAALTIFATSGIDANAGLPGVRPGSARTQYVEEIAPDLRLVFKQMFQDHIDGSVYFTRGWTFQEWELAKRSLIFIGGQVVYKCAVTDQCREDEVIEERHLKFQGLGGNSRENDIGEVEEIIYEYSSRLLTYDDDVYHAFAAMLHKIKKVLNANLCHGIPDVIFDWFLLWTPSALQSRRKSNPSWSWTGWVGRSSIAMWESYTRSITRILGAMKKRTWIVWYERKAHDSEECVRVGAKSASEDSASTKRMQKRFSFDISRKTPTPRTLIGAPKFTDDTYNPSPGSGFLQFWTISVMFDLDKATTVTEDSAFEVRYGHNRVGFRGRDGRELGTVIVLPEWYEANIPGRHEFILLCEGRTDRPDRGREDEEPGWMYRVMLIDWHGQGQWAERVAIGAIEKRDLDQALGKGPVWKEIVLG